MVRTLFDFQLMDIIEFLGTGTYRHSTALVLMESRHVIDYRGYRINTENVNGHWHVTVWPMLPDLPILRRYLLLLAQATETEALSEIKRKIDRLLCL